MWAPARLHERLLLLDPASAWTAKAMPLARKTRPSDGYVAKYSSKWCTSVAAFAVAAACWEPITRGPSTTSSSLPSAQLVPSKPHQLQIRKPLCTNCLTMSPRTRRTVSSSAPAAWPWPPTPMQDSTTRAAPIAAQAPTYTSLR